MSIGHGRALYQIGLYVKESGSKLYARGERELRSPARKPYSYLFAVGMPVFFLALAAAARQQE